MFILKEDIIKKLGLPTVECVSTTEGLNVTAADVLILGVAREDVIKGRVERYVREFERFGRRKNMSQVRILFDGWEHDPREVYQIREITNWAARLLKNVPHLFYFLAPEDYAMRVFFMCIVDVKSRAGDKVSISKEEGKALIEKVSKSAVSFAKKSKESAERQFHLAESILHELGYDETA